VTQQAGTPLRIFRVDPVSGARQHRRDLEPADPAGLSYVRRAGLTAEQAFWKPGNGDHSVAELVSHLLFWDKQQLATFKGEKAPAYSGKNDDTFQMVDKGNWDAAVRELDAVMTGWEKAVAAADDATLPKFASTIAHISAHNAYHTGQILYIRKQQGSWDAAKGVH
jgi:uncharacterized damage-inducible protein DinB